MPKQLQPETYEQFLGISLMNAARKKGKTQAQLAAFVGLSERTFSRRMAGDPGFTVREIESLAGYLGANPGEILQDALDSFGGIGKLLSEVRRTNQVSNDDAEVLGTLTQLSRRESQEVEQERLAALEGTKESDQ